MPTQVKKLPVTVLSGFLGAGKTTLLKHILTNVDGLKVCVIVNDMASLNFDAEMVKGHGMVKAEESMIQLENGCICCTLREDLLVEVRKLAKSGDFDYLVVESTGVADVLPVAETWSFTPKEGEDGEAGELAALSEVSTLDTLVTVVSVPTFIENLKSMESLAERYGDDDMAEEDDRDIASLLVDQVEFANVILLNKTDVATEEEVKKVRAIVTTLNPTAKIILSTKSAVDIKEVMNTGLFDMEKAMSSPQWMSEARGEESHETEIYNITSFVYRRRKPFHPQRLWDLADKSVLDSTYRSKGFLWLANVPDIFIEWSTSGPIQSTDPGDAWLCTLPKDMIEEMNAGDQLKAMLVEGQEEHGDRRQEIVFIGTEMDQEGLEEALDAALLTEEEFAKGPEFWMTLEDPFEMTMSEDEEESDGEPCSDEECEAHH